MAVDRPPEAAAKPQEIALHVKYELDHFVVDLTANVRTIAARLLTDDEVHRVSARAERVFVINGKFENSPTLVAVTVTLRRDLEQVLLLEAEGAEGPLDLTVLRPPQSAIATAATSALPTGREQPAFQKPDSKPAEKLVPPEVIATNIAIAAFLGQQARDGDEGVKAFIERLYGNKEMGAGVEGWDSTQDVGVQLHLLSKVAMKGRVAELVRALAFLKANNAAQMSHKEYAIRLLRRMAGEPSLKDWASKALAELKAAQPELFQAASVDTRIGTGKALPSLRTLVSRITGGSMAQVEFSLVTLSTVASHPTIGNAGVSDEDIDALGEAVEAINAASQSFQNRGGANRTLMVKLQEAARRQKIPLGELHQQVKARHDELTAAQKRKK